MLNKNYFPRILVLATLFGLAHSGLALAAEKRIVGLNERLYIAEIDLELNAKLDTGAQTSSLSAHDIKHFDKDGEPWVRFRLAIKDAPEHSYELPLARVSRIKRRSSGGDEDTSSIKRPVVTMTVSMGTQQHAIEVNLADRSRFEFPMLMGASALQQFSAIVDPSVEYMAGAPALNPLNSSESDN